MKNYLSPAKRIIAVIITLMMIMGACFVGMVSALAAPTDNLTATAIAADDAYIPTSGSQKTVTDIEGGGINYSVVKCGSYFPYVNKNNLGAFPGNGVRLQFSNYVSTASSADSDKRGYHKLLIGICRSLVNDDYYKFVTGVAGILIDTVNGTVQLAASTSSGMNAYDVKQTIITNDALKYDNFTGKEFSLTFAQNGDRGILLKMVVGTTNLSGVIEYANYSTIAKWPATNTYITVGGVDNDGNFHNSWSVDYYGYQVGIQPDFAAGLDAYASSTTNKMAASGNVILTDLPGGGVNYNATAYSAYFPYAYTVNVGGYGNGYKLLFSNYTDTSAVTDSGHGQFLIMMGAIQPADDDYYKFKPNMVGIDIDTVNGRVLLVESNSNSMQSYVVLQTLITDDIFKYANFTGNAFSLTFNDSGTGGGDILLRMTVGSKDFSAIIDFDLYNSICLTDFAKKVATATSTFIYFGGIYNGSTNKCNVNFYGYDAGIRPDYAEGLDNYSSSSTNTLTATDYGNSVTVTNYASGGVNYNAKSNSGYFPYVYTQNLGGYPGQGFKLQFANYSDTSPVDATGHGIFLVMLTRSIGADYHYKFKTNVVGVAIDTVNGQALLVESTSPSMLSYAVQQTLITDDALKYANFTGKAFSLTFTRSGTDLNDVELQINIHNTADDTVLSGIIDYDKFAEVLDAATGALFASETNCYVSFGGIYNGGASSICKVDFFGFDAGILPSYAEDLDHYYSSADSYYNDGIAGNAEVLTDYTAGGLNINYKKCSAYFPYVYNHDFGAFPGNGITLQFANYRSTASAADSARRGYRQFLIGISKSISSDNYYKFKIGVAGLLFDTVNGQVQLVAGTHAGMITHDVIQTVITDDALKYENFANKAFSVSFLPNNDGNILVQVKILDKVVSGVIDYAKLSSIEHAPTTSTYLTVGGIDNDGAFDNIWYMDLLGYKMNAGTVSVGTVNAAAGSTVQVPLAVTTNGLKSIDLSVAIDTDGLTPADGDHDLGLIDATGGDFSFVSGSYADGVYSLSLASAGDSDVFGTNVAMINLYLTIDGDAATGSVYPITANVTGAKATGGDGDVDVKLCGGTGLAVVTANAPGISNENIRYAASSPLYDRGTLAFGTELSALASDLPAGMTVVEYGTVFFTKKMLGGDELVMGYKNSVGQSSIYVSKIIESGDTIPDMYIAILRDRTSDNGYVSDGYYNTTYVARSFIRCYDSATGASVVIYGNKAEMKTATLNPTLK